MNSMFSRVASYFRIVIALSIVGALQMCEAAVELVSPVGGTIVELLPKAQRKVMSLPTLATRLRLLNEDKKNGMALHHDKYWRKAIPLVLKWRATADEKGPWKLEIGKSPDLLDARIWFIRVDKVDVATGREIGKTADAGRQAEILYMVPMANLEIACEYYWRVTSFGRCGFLCGIHHGCEKSKAIVRSQMASFRTEDVAPRWIEIEGQVLNFRDLGGWRTKDGRRVKQGMAYRGQGLNDNSVTGEMPGKNRLTADDLRYMTENLGIRTDLDLRSNGETADMKMSPLGEGVKFVNISSQSYRDVFTDDGKQVMARNFRVFCDRSNYPIYFHCIGGADRTGSLAYVLNGVLGVDRHDLETDWEATFYPDIPDANPNPDHWCRESHFNDGFARYGKEDDSWNRRIELYLQDCGITADEIAAFRTIMLEPENRNRSPR